MIQIHRMLGTAALFLTACQQVYPPLASAVGETDVIQVQTNAPVDNRSGKCWGTDMTLALVVVVNETKTVMPGTEYWFQVPCPAEINAEFIATLQRALKARDLFYGDITGVMDAKTAKSVRLYQKQHGLDSSILSLAAARQLGLLAYDRPASG